MPFVSIKVVFSSTSSFFVWAFSFEVDDMKLSGRLPGRTDNEVKNYWNPRLRRKLINMGINPNHHRLNHSLPHLQSLGASTSTTSSASKSHECQPVKCHVDNNQVSDAVSVLEDDPRGLPDLNLSLTLDVPSHSIANAEE
ncbi:unnamed protein product [Ilex paraguariensis]|uniref:HTH myb-type domain-containing protein n=1 Tax=Ilex paraguariensis TaxID=185542 RepID=A0ABC8SI74_9AQUA